MTQHFVNGLFSNLFSYFFTWIAFGYLLFDWQLGFESTDCPAPPVQSHSACMWTRSFLTPSLSLLTSACHDTSYTHTHPNTFTYAAAIHQSSTSSVFIAWLNIENYSTAPKHILMNFSWVSKQMGGGKDAGGVREDTHLLL